MKRLVLAGAGHAHAQVLRDWASAPLRGVEVCLVSPEPRAPYSGMVPGWLAGHFGYDDICIDFAALCTAAGARYVRDELCGIDADARHCKLRSGGSLGYDLLSLNVGSTLEAPVLSGTRVLSMRPLGRLRTAWEAVLAELAERPADAPLTVTAVGGGAAGIESLLAVRHRLRTLAPRRTVHAGLMSRSATLLPGASAGAVRRVQRALREADVAVQLGSSFCPAAVQATDLLLWATGAQAHAWQRDGAAGALALDAQGFVRVDRQLRSASHPAVYAVGDCAAWAEPLPKAGVYAVRMGPPLSRNLRAALGEGVPVGYTPQHRYLALLSTGARHAIATRGGWSVEGRWVWHWKDHIDRGFLRRFDVAGSAVRLSTARTDSTTEDPA